MSSPYPQNIALNLISNAANIADGENPAFTRADFIAFYPQFTGKVSDGILDQFVAMANAVVLQARWHDMWNFGMCLFIAHFVTLYLQTLSGGVSATASQVIESAKAKGLQTSKSVGDLSVGYDYSAILTDINGWPMWRTTEYGLQFMQYARLLGKGGMYVW